MRLFARKPRKPQFGLINCLNNRGLGTESRILEEIFSHHFPDIDFHLYKVKAGKSLQEFDQQWHKNNRFKKWLLSKDVVMTIEVFMPELFRFCRKNGVKTIWRPNFEWISPELTRDDFELVDFIVTPQTACSEFLQQRFQLQNVHPVPWITMMPVFAKQPYPGSTRFLFNAGRGGIGDRRNTRLVIDSFAEVLGEYDDIHLTIKTQIDLDLTPLSRVNPSHYTYVRKNTNYKKNLAYYRQSDFSLAPSKWEGLGFALLESLYNGTPVLTVDAPPMNEWVSHQQTGYLAPAYYPDLPLPIPYTRQNENGLNWVRAALCKQEDFIAGIVWLHENKTQLYQQFNQINADTLNARQTIFLDRFRAILHTERP